MNVGDLTIILMAHNRPNYAKDAVSSILNQTSIGFSFIISDNSTNKEFHDIIKKQFSNIKYISHFPGISAEEHFSKVRLLVNTSHFLLFHDDDLLDKNFVANVIFTINQYPKLAAIGTNGFFIDSKSDRVSSKKIFTSKSNIISFESSAKFIRQYLCFDSGGAAPFSSYVYNKELISNIEMDWSQGRAYFDTIFLLNIADKLKLIWLNEPLVSVRCHDGRISSNCGVRDYKSFIKLIEVKYNNGIHKIELLEYHFVQLYYNLKKIKKYPFPAVKFLLTNFIFLLILSKSFRARVINFIFNHN